MLTDPSSDYLTRIRNGLTAGQTTVDIPCSKLKLEMSRILTEQGMSTVVSPAFSPLRIRVR
ncbi:MAG: 30S ribosomal protein S8 [Solirubrobacterales bacterium]